MFGGALKSGSVSPAVIDLAFEQQSHPGLNQAASVQPDEQATPILK